MQIVKRILGTNNGANPDEFPIDMFHSTNG